MVGNCSGSRWRRPGFSVMGSRLSMGSCRLRGRVGMGGIMSGRDDCCMLACGWALVGYRWGDETATKRARVDSKVPKYSNAFNGAIIRSYRLPGKDVAVFFWMVPGRYTDEGLTYVPYILSVLYDIGKYEAIDFHCPRNPFFYVSNFGIFLTRYLFISMFSITLYPRTVCRRLVILHSFWYEFRSYSYIEVAFESYRSLIWHTFCISILPRDTRMFGQRHWLMSSQGQTGINTPYSPPLSLSFPFFLFSHTTKETIIQTSTKYPL